MEVWKKIKEFPNYSASSLGKIRNDKSGHIKAHCSDGRGYRLVFLYSNKIGKTVRVHILIAKTFIPNPENKEYINHKDGIKDNNVVSNLEWVTPKENSDHATSLGLQNIRKGSDHGMSKLTEIEVKEIRELKQSTNISIDELAAKYGLKKRSIYSILSRETWKHI